MPIVQNDDIPVEDEIVKGGILHAGTNFSNPSDREKIDPSLYKFSEQAIVSSEFANKFNINLEHTYNKEQLEKLTGKTFIELYPDYPSWNRPPQGGVVTFSSVDGKPGNFLPTMYNSTGYTYDNVNNQYIGEEVFLNIFVPEGDPIANGINNGTEVESNVKVHTFNFTGPAPVPPDADPVIDISGSNPVSITQGQTYNDAGAIATDVVDGNLTSSISTTSNVNTSTIGTYQVQYNVSDSAGNNVTATRTVNVVAGSGDTTPPVITINGSNPVSITQGQTYTDAGATYADVGDGVTGITITNANTVSNVNTSSAGTYQVVYSATDNAGNNTTATRTVNVVSSDTTAPVITINGSNPVTVTANTSYTDAGASYTDNVDGGPTTITSQNTTSNVNITLPGTYTVTYTATDAAGNTATAQRTVNVTAGDTTPPVITVTGSNPVTIFKDSTYADAGATWTDNVDGGPFTITGSNTTSNVNITLPGTYTVTYTATDAAGNTATATRTVYVVADNTPPVITMNGATNPYQVAQNTTYVDPGATATDNADGTITLTSANVTINVNTAVQGTNYTVVYSVTDAAGNNATATRYVHVVAPADTTPPTLTLSGPNPLNTMKGNPFNDPGATATDDVDGNLDANITNDSSTSLDVNTVGTYTVTYSVSDAAGNTATATRTVYVIN
jgi:hypothetical protein